MTKHKFSFSLSGLTGRRGAVRVKQAPAADERRSRFDAELQKGVDDAEQGATKDADEVFDRLETKYRAMSKKRG